MCSASHAAGEAADEHGLANTKVRLALSRSRAHARSAATAARGVSAGSVSVAAPCFDSAVATGCFVVAVFWRYQAAGTKAAMRAATVACTCTGSILAWILYLATLQPVSITAASSSAATVTALAVPAAVIVSTAFVVTSIIA